MSDTKNIPATAPYIRMNQPAIRLKLGYEMSINRRVLYALDNPRYINFWWSRSQRVLLIGVATEDAPFSVKVDERYYKGKTGFRINNSQFLQMIMELADWHDNMICAVQGNFVPELNMVAFKLDEAEKSDGESDVAVHSNGM